MTDYYDHPAVSQSQLKRILRSAAHCRSYLEVEQEDTPALQFGRAFHALVLEDQELFAVAPDINRRTKAGKEEWARFQAENEGKAILKADEFEHLAGMAKAIEECKEAQGWLEGEREAELFFSAYGLDCKSRLDVLNREHHRVVDVKSCQDASLDGFARAARMFQYDFQAGFYTLAAEMTDPIGGVNYSFCFICVEKTPPYAVATYELSQRSLTIGRDKVYHAVHEYRSALASGEWLGYPQYQTLEV